MKKFYTVECRLYKDDETVWVYVDAATGDDARDMAVEGLLAGEGGEIVSVKEESEEVISSLGR